MKRRWRCLFRCIGAMALLARVSGAEAQGAPLDGEPTPHTYRRVADAVLHAYVSARARPGTPDGRAMTPT